MPSARGGLQVVFTIALSAHSTELETWLQRNLARIVAGLVLGALVLSSGSARADERTEARAHFKKGMADIADGKYDVGIEELKKAYDILPHPNVLYNIARAYVDQGDLENAVAYYKKYLEGNPKDRDEVAQIVAALEARIRKQQAELARGAAGADAAAARHRARRAGRDAGRTAPGRAAGTQPGGTDGAGRRACGREQAASAPAQGLPDGGARRRKRCSRRPSSPRRRRPRAPSTRRTPRRSSPSRTSASRASRRSPSCSGASPASTSWRPRARRPRSRCAASTSACRTRCSSSSTAAACTSTSSAPRSGRPCSIGVEDIERIEVVRGPGSALYGADAFNGVINIITKTPGEGGSGFNVGYGDHNTTHGTIYASGRDKELAYRLSAGYDYLPRWSREVAGRPRRT